MEISTIAQAKNHLPKLIHSAEAGEDVRISRHGKVVAILVSVERYQQHFQAGKGVFSAMMRWRESNTSLDLTSDEVDSLRDRSPARDFVWE
ncbi:hypothetical protein OYT1_ch1494 [Ferriphaselus amnicola]|uniref:Antitoxin n=1 Tax=Ferriphaselus amnicola TaxID=1188319 RepID=A0A2Z6GC13_9PROT|nr:type II toxin-antitoxin system prevent-host-death family antitoxin [Ferriphaselus amnicola]BBE51048.1 hypothetical protein OYT1_ch1494 [Ferriphaselus amnicola]